MRFCFLFLILFPFAVVGQNKQIDSLTLALQTAKEDTMRVRLHISLSKQFALSDIAKASDHAEAAEKLAADIKFLPGLATALQQRGNLLFMLGEFDKSMAKHYQALTFGQQLKDTSIIINAYIGLGALSNNTKDEEKAFAYYASAEKLAEKSKNVIGLSRIYNNIGHIHAENKRNKKALDYFLKAEQAIEPTGNKKIHAVIRLNIGEIYTLLGQPRKGRAYLEEALALDEQIQNKMNKPLLLSNIAKTYLAENNLAAALRFALDSYKVAVEIGSSKKTLAAAQLVTEIYAKENNFERAYYSQTIANEHSAKLALENQNRNAAEMTARFENEKLDLETQKLKAEKEKQLLEIQHQRIFMAVGLIALFLLGIWVVELYLRRKHLKKNNRLLEEVTEQLQVQNLEIISQKSEIAGQAHALKQQNEELEKHSQFKNKIFSIVSHDLRSPFTSLQGIIALAKEDKLAEKDLKRIFMVLGKDVEVINAMLNNLLVWSKNQMDGSGFQPQLVNLLQLSQDSMQLVAAKAEQKNVSIDVAIEENVIAKADHESLAFVLRNLLENAVKFSYPGEKILVSATQGKEAIKLSVADAGKGISQRNQAKLFSNRRFTTLGTSNEVGTGLGLMLCKELLSSQNGSIEVESEEGRGTVFSVILPVAPVTEAKKEQLESELELA